MKTIYIGIATTRHTVCPLTLGQFLSARQLKIRHYLPNVFSFFKMKVWIIILIISFFYLLLLQKKDVFKVLKHKIMLTWAVVRNSRGNVLQFTENHRNKVKSQFCFLVQLCCEFCIQKWSETSRSSRSSTSVTFSTATSVIVGNSILVYEDMGQLLTILNLVFLGFLED